jgi:hypothetical protein
MTTDMTVPSVIIDLSCGDLSHALRRLQPMRRSFPRFASIRQGNAPVPQMDWLSSRYLRYGCVKKFEMTVPDRGAREENP